MILAVLVMLIVALLGALALLLQWLERLQATERLMSEHSKPAAEALAHQVTELQREVEGFQVTLESIRRGRVARLR